METGPAVTGGIFGAPLVHPQNTTGPHTAKMPTKACNKIRQNATKEPPPPCSVMPILSEFLMGRRVNLEAKSVGCTILSRAPLPRGERRHRARWQATRGAAR